MSALFMMLSMMSLDAPMTVEVNRDRLTEQVSAVATLRTGDNRLELGCTPNQPRRIWVRLRSNRWFREGNPFNGNIVFRHRFDDRPARSLTWSVRERTAMLVGRSRVERFVLELADARQIIIRARGPERRRYDLVFEIAGARQAMSRALEACNDPFRDRLVPST